MSETYRLVCHETKKAIWVGQGWGSMSSFYSGEATTMKRLGSFLRAHEGQPLILLCTDRNDTITEYDEWEKE